MRIVKNFKNTLTYLIISVSVILACCIVSCSPRASFFPGSYLKNDRIYTNKAIGFSLLFQGSWNIMTEQKSFTPVGKKLSLDLSKLGAELLFMGSTTEGTQGTRAIAAHLNLPALTYAEKIRAANTSEVSADSGITEFTGALLPMVRWEYWTGGFHFVEFFMQIETYNIRIAFWASNETFTQFIPIYESMIRSIEVVSPTVY